MSRDLCNGFGKSTFYDKCRYSINWIPHLQISFIHTNKLNSLFQSVAMVHLRIEIIYIRLKVHFWKTLYLSIHKILNNTIFSNLCKTMSILLSFKPFDDNVSKDLKRQFTQPVQNLFTYINCKAIRYNLNSVSYQTIDFRLLLNCFTLNIFA